MERVWASEQRRDHAKYRSIVSAARESIALRPSGDWDSTSRQGSFDDTELRPVGSAAAAHPQGDYRNAVPVQSSRLRNEVDYDSRSATKTGGAGSVAGYSDAYNGTYGRIGDGLAEQGYDYPQGGAQEHAGYGRDEVPAKSSARQQYYQPPDGGMLRKGRPY